MFVNFLLTINFKLVLLTLPRPSLLWLGDDLLGASAEIRAKLAGEYEKIARMYGAESGMEMNEFPTFTFTEPELDLLATETVDGSLKSALTS